jgi:YidC/Oxa1 family membrane protein insertase
LTLNDAQYKKAGVAFMTEDLAISFSDARLFGAKLSETFLTASDTAVQILAAVMVIVMTITQFITQRQIMSKNQNPDVQNSQYMQTQKIMLYVFPIIFMISGVSFPLAVMFYWLTSNFWTMGQQFVVIRNMPTPGSIAHKQREERLAKKGKLPKQAVVEEAAEETPTTTQRQQPEGKKRAKKKKK